MKVKPNCPEVTRPARFTHNAAKQNGPYLWKPNVPERILPQKRATVVEDHVHVSDLLSTSLSSPEEGHE